MHALLFLAVGVAGVAAQSDASSEGSREPIKPDKMEHLLRDRPEDVRLFLPALAPGETRPTVARIADQAKLTPLKVEPNSQKVYKFPEHVPFTVNYRPDGQGGRHAAIEAVPDTPSHAMQKIDMVDQHGKPANIGRVQIPQLEEARPQTPRTRQWDEVRSKVGAVETPEAVDRILEQHRGSTSRTSADKKANSEMEAKTSVGQHPEVPASRSAAGGLDKETEMWKYWFRERRGAGFLGFHASVSAAASRRCRQPMSECLIRFKHVHDHDPSISPHFLAAGRDIRASHAARHALFDATVSSERPSDVAKAFRNFEAQRPNSPLHVREKGMHWYAFASRKNTAQRSKLVGATGHAPSNRDGAPQLLTNGRYSSRSGRTTSSITPS